MDDLTKGKALGETLSASQLQTGTTPITTENVLQGAVPAPDEDGAQRATQAPVVTVTLRAAQIPDVPVENPTPGSFHSQILRTPPQDDPFQVIWVRPLVNLDPGSSRTAWESNDCLSDVENNLIYISKCMEEVRAQSERLFRHLEDSPRTRRSDRQSPRISPERLDQPSSFSGLEGRQT
ncbi:hypothetical protein CJ030_MR1G008464 [Morella rubra]|uniref:Uncharacterized protein n=1 Tax=Morella rubra TaxID=262757 RepID=A0A6A1WSA8_9ROSI|nr:hypothetical protein CJ030_MR1G008464 [Morella rubra]